MISMTGEFVPVSYSTIAISSIVSGVLSRYNIGTIKACRFWHRGLSDVYLVETEQKPYILRVSHCCWRCKSEIDFELLLLKFLHQHNLPVAHPIATESGELLIGLAAPEGPRYASLFIFAPGIVPIGDLNSAQATKLGETIAKVHQAGLAFDCAAERNPLTPEYLLDQSWAEIQPFLKSDDREYVESAIADIKQELNEFPRSSPYWTVCWGDPHSGNAHFTPDDQPTLFDFDQCGFGWRAFELGKFRQCALSTGVSRSVRDAFLSGYQSVNPLEAFELEAIPVFTQMAQIWVWSIGLTYALKHDYSRVDDRYFQKRLEQLKTLKSPDWQLF